MRNWEPNDIKFFEDFKKSVEIKLIEKGMEKKELAERLGIAASKLSLLFSTKDINVAWTMPYLLKLAKVLDISIVIEAGGIKVN